MYKLDEEFLKMIIPIPAWWYDVIVKAHAYHYMDGDILVCHNGQKLRCLN